MLGLEKDTAKKDSLCFADQLWRKEKLNVTKTFHDIDNLSTKILRLLHLYSKNYCTSLRGNDLSGKPTEHRTTSMALVYLSILNTCYKTIHQVGKYDSWASMYTFLGILQAPMPFQDFTLVKSLYKGGDIGEGIIKELRPLSPTGIKDGWAQNLIEIIIIKMLYTI